MRAFLIAVALSAITASAESPQAGAQVPRSCAECLVLTPAQVEQLKSDMLDLTRQAYKAGQQDARERCASLI